MAKSGEPTELGKLLVVAMREKGISRAELAQATNLAPSTVSRYIVGEVRPDAKVLAAMAATLGLPFEQLAAAAGLNIDRAAMTVPVSPTENARNEFIFQMRSLAEPDALDGWDVEQRTWLRSAAIKIAAAADASLL